ncbi:efflux transporter periplasmic adaptor subunit [Pseudanabaena sp. SR411]|uniref:efflux RND transporter periplasmic adaptor subunit n=1 Tax=Pseudanabaena sp. SR411 TaxID=1980935 RepID=UPI000B999DFE|nr:efflux RND transporter periplasmic adaptor subunit [Pseudanabaena sp. SR411]OYQ61640.1 efflux transporter periplasmic adaptor subunit [Pseudanabaena sp. SR411]
MLSDSVSNLKSTQASAKKPLWQQKRFKWGLLIVLFLGSGSWGFQILNSASTNRSQAELLTQSVERKTVPISITANGTINPERSINLSPKSSGVIKTLLVKEGDRVRQGQAIAIMDDSGLRGQMIQAEGQIAQQEASLQSLVAGNRPEDIAKAQFQLNSAQIELRQAEEDLNSNKSLYESGAISRQTYQKAVTSRDIAQASVLQSQQSLVLSQTGSRSEDITEARARVESALGSLQSIQTQLDDTQVVAPFDGIVIKKYADVGAFVSPSIAGSGASASSSSILTLASNRLQVVVNLSESQISKVKLGQSVKIKADAFLGETFTGKVEQIAPQATVSQNVTSFEVRVSITSPTAEKLKSGMNVEAQFEIGRLENALLVPNAAVVKQAEGEGVFVMSSDRQPIFKPIQTGLTIGTQTEVKSGLQGNEQIILSSPFKEQSTPLGLNLPKAPAP